MWEGKVNGISFGGRNNNGITMTKPVAGFNANPQNINRDGAPKKEWTMTAMYREAAEEASETGEPKYKIVARKLIKLAEKGDMVAIKELGNRLDGMPQQNSDITSKGEKIEGNTIIFTNFTDETEG